MSPRPKGTDRFAEKIAGLLEADKGIREWWTDRSQMPEKEAAKAARNNDPTHLYLDEGGNDLIVVTVRRVPKPKGYKNDG